MTVPHLTHCQVDNQDIVQRRHPKFWLDDGSLIISVQDDIFKVHRTLLCRHSPALTKWSTDESSHGSRIGATNGLDGCEVVLVPPEVAGRMRSEDMLALLEHLYHDVPLSVGTPFPRLASVLRVSSPRQLDFPAIYELAKDLIEKMFPSGPEPFQHPDCLEEALGLAVEYRIQSIQKGLYYSLVTTSDFDMNANDTHDPPIPKSKIEGPSKDGQQPAPPPAPHHHLSLEASRRCTSLMNSLISHFTPILFTPAATPHMACTDVFADTWMGLVIQPALECDGVYKPLETLEKMRTVDWRKEGLCESCVKEKREEWRGEQGDVWRRMDGWLGLDGWMGNAG